jgi:putative PEP-CTERM system histidine kinase
MNFATASYAAAAVAYALLLLVLLAGWRGRALATRFLIAVIVTALWATVIAVTSRREHMPFFAVFVTEVLRDAGWLVLLSAMARGFAPRALIVCVQLLWIGLLVAGVLLPLVGRQYIGDNATIWLSRSGLALSFAAFVLIEQIYRNATSATQKSLRYFVLGVGSLFAYDLFLYAQAELVRGINADAWAARGAVTALAAPLIAVAVRRNPDWALDIFVSRQVVFYSTAFLAAGSYLLLMAIGGYYVRAMDGTWGGVAQILFFAGAALVLAVLIFSNAMRRRLMVFISKHFYRNKYDYRVEWLRFIQTLSSRSDADIRVISLRAIAQIFSSPSGILFTLGDDGRRYVPVAVWPNRRDRDEGPDHEPAADVPEISADHELPQFLQERQWVIDLAEYARAPDRYQNIELPEWLSQRSQRRIVSPLLELDRLVGFVVLDDPPPPFELTYEDHDLLKTIGRHVATYLSQHEANRKLAESRQFEAFSRLTAFMMHDLKNAVAQLSLIVANAARHKNNPEFIDDAIGTIGNAADRMTRLIEQLQRGTSHPADRRTELLTLVERAATRCASRKPVPELTLPDHGAVVVADPERLTMVLEHVIRNAQEATREHGRVQLDLQYHQRTVEIAIIDDGQGMDPAFVRDRLFRPFDSTKGSKGMGIGAYQAREYVRSLGGDVMVESKVGVGTRFVISLPRIVAENTDRIETSSQAGSPRIGQSALLPDEGTRAPNYTATT